MSTPRRIAVMTSGGDAPGMNAAVRAVTRCAVDRHWEVVGVKCGYAGLVGGNFIDLDARAVGGIIHLGGTFLGSSRCPEFRTEPTQREALRQLATKGIDALVVIGGNGSQAGAAALGRLGFPVVGIPSTIDNDLWGTDVTIGVDTALNIALEAIDRLRVTAASHHRGFLVEVMGRNCGYLALMAGIAGGAELVLIPEAEWTVEAVEQELHAVHARGKPHAIVVVAEGCRLNVAALLERLKHKRAAPIEFELRATTLGHVQRGGSPTVADRLLASRLGAAAVETLGHAGHGVLVGFVGGRPLTTPLAEAMERPKPLNPDLLALAATLER